jgi:2-polyprenyl-3-methyl-5-hydroxy-6-metoxy-1,4-benzoquinol methylase
VIDESQADAVLTDRESKRLPSTASWHAAEMLERNNRAAGPLRNLASHVPGEWWRTLFGALYLRTDGDVVEDDRITAQEVDVLVAAAALSRRHRILDLCCGQGRHALELARRGFDHVTGLDHSSFLVQLARQRASASALPGTFREGDARESLPDWMDANTPSASSATSKAA